MFINADTDTLYLHTVKQRNIYSNATNKPKQKYAFFFFNILGHYVCSSSGGITIITVKKTENQMLHV